MTIDLVVLGGGISGLGVARLAARNGWSVTLLERGDLAGGASSASSHMLHGGLRYLEHGHFALVREALAERATVTRMAPSLATPVRFLVPRLRGERLAGWKLHAGLTLYDALAGGAGFSAHTMARGAEALALEPGLHAARLLGAGLYTDVVMDDARLAVAVARDAAAHGAVLRTRTTLVSARASSDEPDALDLLARDHDTREEFPLRTRRIVNATGAHCDETRRELARLLTPGRPDPAPLLRPSRGVHLVYPALTHGHGVLVTAAADGRVFFVIPFAGRSLVGTTEVETSRPPAPADGEPTLDEIRYLAREVTRILPEAGTVAPVAITSGLRPLLDSGPRVGSASREHRVIEEGPVVTIAGGKYTTFRVMARHVLELVARRLGRDPGRIADAGEPLPAPLAQASNDAALGAHAVEHEFARHLDDVLRRRSTRWLADDGGLGAAPAVADAMGRRLGWAPERVREELDAWEAQVRDGRSRMQTALSRGL